MFYADSIVDQKDPHTVNTDLQIIHPLVQQEDDAEVLIADDGPGEPGRDKSEKELVFKGVVVTDEEYVKDSTEVSIGDGVEVFKGFVVFTEGGSRSL